MKDLAVAIIVAVCVAADFGADALHLSHKVTAGWNATASAALTAAVIWFVARVVGLGDD